MRTPKLVRTRISVLIGGLFVTPLIQALPIWTGGAGNGNWTSASNWSGGVAPTLAGTAVFGSAGSGGSNQVNQGFTIGGLTYNANSSHTTNIGLGIALNVRGPTSIGVGDSANGAKVTWAGGGRVAIGTAASPMPLFVGVNDTYANNGTSFGQLTLADITVDGNISELAIGRKTNPYNGDSPSGANGVLALGANSKLYVGSSTAWARNVNIGVNDQPSGTVTGLLDVRQGTAAIYTTNFTVGGGTSADGPATGTLRWNRSTPIYATNMYFGRGVGTGVLDLAPAATFVLGSSASPTSLLAIGYNDNYAGSGSAAANLDLTLNNPVFTAYVGSELAIGRKTNPYNGDSPSGANGVLALGANSKLYVGSSTAWARNVNIGVNDQPSGTVTGLLDVRQGTAAIYTTNFTVGGGTSADGPATGTLKTGAKTVIDTAVLNIGTGPGGNGTVQLAGGVVTAKTVNVGPGGHFTFGTGTLNVKAFNGNLIQDGGRLSVGSLAGTLSVSGGYSLASAGTLGIAIRGNTQGTLYDQLAVHGAVNLNSNGGSGGKLDLLLGYAPVLGSTFTIIDNDGTDAVIGSFQGLGEGARLTTTFGSASYAFSITYRGGTGNDVVLKDVGPGILPLGMEPKSLAMSMQQAGVSMVPEPGSFVLFSFGMIGLLGWRRFGTKGVLKGTRSSH